MFGTSTIILSPRYNSVNKARNHYFSNYNFRLTSEPNRKIDIHVISIAFVHLAFNGNTAQSE
jgi:hypothetical protein